MSAKILLVNRSANAAELRNAFVSARVSYGVINAVAPDTRQVHAHLGHLAYDVVIVDQLAKGAAEDVVHAVLNKVPWQQMVIIGKRPSIDLAIQVHLAPTLGDAIGILPDLLR